MIPHEPRPNLPKRASYGRTVTPAEYVLAENGGTCARPNAVFKHRDAFASLAAGPLTSTLWTFPSDPNVTSARDASDIEATQLFALGRASVRALVTALPEGRSGRPSVAGAGAAFACGAGAGAAAAPIGAGAAPPIDARSAASSALFDFAPGAGAAWRGAGSGAAAGLAAAATRAS